MKKNVEEWISKFGRYSRGRQVLPGPRWAGKKYPAPWPQAALFEFFSVMNLNDQMLEHILNDRRHDHIRHAGCRIAGAKET